MGENAFHMVFQERWVFSHSSPNPALAATRLWAGYGELVGENSISPGKPCEMHIFSYLAITDKEVSLVMTTPESCVMEKWAKVWIARKQSIACLAFDEVHCLEIW